MYGTTNTSELRMTLLRVSWLRQLSAPLFIGGSVGDSGHRKCSSSLAAVF